MKLLDVYRAVLEFCSLQADDSDRINVVLDDEKNPAVIGTARLVLPTKEHLRDYDPKKTIYFHPLTENIFRGESEIVKYLRRQLNIRLNYFIGVIGQNLLALVADQTLHSRLTPSQAELLTSVSFADTTLVSNFAEAMIAGLTNKPDHVFVNIHLHTAGKFQGHNYARVGVTSFPFYKELLKGEVKKIRVKDREPLKQLFEFMFPGIDVPETYNSGSNDKTARFLDALLKAGVAVSSRISDLVELYKDYIPGSDKITFNTDWMTAFEDLETLRPEIRMIPVQYGNDGTVSIVEKKKEEQNATLNEHQSQIHKPSIQELQARQQQQQPQPQQQAPSQYPPQNWQQPPPPQQLPKPGGKLDLSAVIAGNPGLAMQPNLLSGHVHKEQMDAWARANPQAAAAYAMQNMQQPPPGYGPPPGTWGGPPVPPWENQPGYPQQVYQQPPPGYGPPPIVPGYGPQGYNQPAYPQQGGYPPPPPPPPPGYGYPQQQQQPGVWPNMQQPNRRSW